MTQRLFLLVALLGVLFLTGCVQQPMSVAANVEEKLLRLPYVSQLDNKEREYFVYLPRNYGVDPAKVWPVMLFLHGNGERGNGLDELDYLLAHGPLYEAWIQKRDLPFIIIAPQLHMFDMDKKAAYIANRTPAQIPQRLAQGTAEWEPLFVPQGPMTAGPEIQDMSQIPITLPVGWDHVQADLLAMLDTVEARFAVDNSRIYLTGLSYGGFGSWYLASHHPERFAAVAPVVGWGHPDLMPAIARAGLPVWAFAAGRDTAVTKPHFYAGMNALERMSEAEVRFTVHEDMAHDAWRRIYAGEDLYRWLLDQQKGKKGSRQWR